MMIMDNKDSLANTVLISLAISTTNLRSVDGAIESLCRLNSEYRGISSLQRGRDVEYRWYSATINMVAIVVR